MSQSLRPARAVSPGHILRRELDARGWTQKDLAAITGRPVQAINEIAQGTKQITPETALELAAAFGTSAELWMNLEANYRLHLKSEEAKKKEIERKSKIYSLAPVAELIKRAWIKRPNTIDELEREVCCFLGISSLEEQPKLQVNFRHSQEWEPERIAKIAWVKRVEHLANAQAKEQNLGIFSITKLENAIPDILSLSVKAEDIVRVPEKLMSLGVHFVLVPHLPKTYLDGAAFYTEVERPVIALTLRHDRIDSFWFTLMHELAHIVLRHEGHLDNLYPSKGSESAEQLGNDSAEESNNGKVKAEEHAANQQARDWLVPRQAFENFVVKTQLYFTLAAIEHFALSSRRHPGIIVGQLQYKQHVEYSFLRRLLVKVKPFLKDWIDVSGPGYLLAS